MQILKKTHEENHFKSYRKMNRELFFILALFHEKPSQLYKCYKSSKALSAVSTVFK